MAKFLRRFSSKRNVILLLFMVSLLPMGLPQYGGGRGMQELSGLIALFGPVGFLALAAAIVGLARWMPSQRANRAFSLCGLLGIVAAELMTFFTWHYETITGELSLSLSLQFVYPEFWFGLTVSCIMALVYWGLEWFLPEPPAKL